jgi:hypothetical protein
LDGARGLIAVCDRPFRRLQFYLTPTVGVPPDAFRLEQTWLELVSFGQLENAQMKPFLMAFAAALVSSTFALADTPVTPVEAEKIKAALDVLGCTGGKMEKETEGSGYFEVDDAKCKDGQYDIKLDKDFKMIAMTRD